MRVRFAAVCLTMLMGVACQPRIPDPTEFRQPAVGTPLPSGHEESIQPDLPVGQSGALVINHTGFPIQVAVSSTITTLPIGQDFLFVLPPGSYDFYIYEPNRPPYVHFEQLQDGRLRYLYISRIGKSDN
jgi:hypothetical protein